MLKRNKKKKNRNLGIFMIFLGLVVCLLNHIYAYYLVSLEESRIDKFIEKMSLENFDINKQDGVTNDNCIGVLEISKLDLRVCFYDKNNTYNDVEYGIEIHEISDMPDVTNGLLVMAAHSGNSKVSYFNKLNKLSYGDELYIYYNNNKYTYELISIYEEVKDGNISIEKKSSDTLLVLTTCSTSDNDKQLVYVCKLT